MNGIHKIHLDPLSVLNVPFQVHDADFTFIVNGKSFKTSRIISDLLSPNICRAHSADPTLDEFPINTNHRGHFSHILNLINFGEHDFPINEIPFISEVIEILGNDKIKITKGYEWRDITVDNVLQMIKEHEKNELYFSEDFDHEINFISENFDEIYEKKGSELKKLRITTLNKILSNENLQSKDEDELLQFVNELYNQNKKYSILFENICFQNVSAEKMNEFLNSFDLSDITNELWRLLSQRLRMENKNFSKNSRHSGRGITFTFSSEDPFNGILNYLQKKSKGNIDNEVNITASSCTNRNKIRQPKNVALFDDRNSFFVSGDFEGSWICFDFKKRKVILSNYTIRSVDGGTNDHYIKSWVIEGSDDMTRWETIDKRENCSYLKGRGATHTFSIDNESPKQYKYIRLRQIGTNWFGSHILLLDSIEFYGKLI